MISFNEFIQKNNLKQKATSNIKNQQKVLSSLSLSDVGIYLRDGPLITDIENVELHPFKGTHWVLYVYFGSYGCSPSQKLPKFFKKRMGYYLFSDYKIPGLTNKRDPYCAGYCL